MNKVLICLLLICSFSFPSFAASWYYLGEDTANSQVYIDNSSVLKDNLYAMVWVKYVDPDGTVAMRRYYINRKLRAYSTMQKITYSPNGDVIENYPIHVLNWNLFPPETVMEKIYKSIW